MSIIFFIFIRLVTLSSVKSLLFKQVDHENDIDEGFGSQSTKETNSFTNLTPKQGKRSYPRTGLSKSTGKKGQTLLSKFGFK